MSEAAANAATSATTSSFQMLTPSQVMVRQSSSVSDNNNNAAASSSNTKNRNRRNQKKKQQQQKGGNQNKKQSTPQQQQQGDVASSSAPAAVTGDDAPSNAREANTEATASSSSNPKQQNQQQTKKKRNRGRNKKKGGPNKSTATGNEPLQQQQQGQSHNSDSKPPPATTNNANENEKQKKKNKNQRNNARRRRNNPKFPWRRHIPAQAVDPITLEPLDALPYPPFALAADEPYLPIAEWPIQPVDEGTDSRQASTRNNNESPEERHRRILAEQWGQDHPAVAATSGEDASEDSKEKPQPSSSQQQPCNLYDGRALAYYMVSQLQFIDPLNRRDLTRDELVNLDAYLQRHGLDQKHAVTEAYDAKGITISTAGAVGATAAGRAAMLQQEAAGLLNALFGHGLDTAAAAAAAPSSANQSNLMRQYYLEHEQQQQQQQQQQPRQQRSAANTRTTEDIGIYGGSGFMVIDDDLNPALRGSAPEFVPSTATAATANNTTSNVNTLWSASHIASRYGHAARVQQEEFPSLAPAASAASTTRQQQQQQPRAAAAPPSNKPKSSTLSKITKAVKKHDPEELQRQYEAREAFLKRAAMSTMSFGANPVVGNSSTTVPSEITTTTTTGPTDAQLERNRAFAQALDIAPRQQQQQQLVGGWARPADGRLDAFGNELATTVYPDSLILRAKERLPLLLKVEKKWKKFLQDDAAASLPLNPMDRPSRALVHEYSDYFKLHTESFDAEPKRYIHCVKLRDTSAPYPLLTDAVREWRGPQPILASTRPTRSAGEDHSSQQTAGQSTRSLPPPPDRTPLPLKPRSTDLSSSSSSTALPADQQQFRDGIPIGGAPSRTSDAAAMMGGSAGGGRFAALERDRPKLALQKRTLPLELPQYEPPSTSTSMSEELLLRQKQRAAEKQRKEREKEAQKQQILEAAFASDDESGGRNDNDFDSDWEEPQALYVESDDEE